MAPDKYLKIYILIITSFISRISHNACAVFLFINAFFTRKPTIWKPIHLETKSAQVNPITFTTERLIRLSLSHSNTPGQMMQFGNLLHGIWLTELFIGKHDWKVTNICFACFILAFRDNTRSNLFSWHASHSHVCEILDFIKLIFLSCNVTDC